MRNIEARGLDRVKKELDGRFSTNIIFPKSFTEKFGKSVLSVRLETSLPGLPGTVNIDLKRTGSNKVKVIASTRKILDSYLRKSNSIGKLE